MFFLTNPAGVPRGPFRGWQGPLVLTVACQGVSAGGPLVPGKRWREGFSGWALGGCSGSCFGSVESCAQGGCAPKSAAPPRTPEFAQVSYTTANAPKSADPPRDPPRNNPRTNPRTNPRRLRGTPATASWGGGGVDTLAGTRDQRPTCRDPLTSNRHHEGALPSPEGAPGNTSWVCERKICSFTQHST